MSTLSLKDKLNEKEKEFHGKDDIFGMTLLTNPGYIDSGRSIMFTSHLRQFVDIKNPDISTVYMGNENTVGKFSTGYYESDSNYIIVDKFSKFPNHPNHLYALFIYDDKKDAYDIIMKKNVENLTEVFGYEYNNDVMDSKSIGDKIHKGEVLYKTTSYDEDMNYRYGKNARIMYTNSTYTTEDAVVCSESFAKKMISKEIETVKVSLNDNDILCNIYGDNKHYKCFPDIGEDVVNKVVAAKRRIYNNQLLYDLKNSNLKKINWQNDTIFSNAGKLLDVTIYCNKLDEEIPDTIFTKQLRKYLKYQTDFFRNIYIKCKELLDSGAKCSSDIQWYYRYSKDLLDPNTKFKDENNSVFSNMIIEFLFARDTCLHIGQKITGRQGNKGVVSKILPDNEMPFLEDGTPIDIMFNSLGVVNRLNSMQLFEQSINFITEQVARRMETIKTLTEKEELLFNIIEMLTEDQINVVKEHYNTLTTKEKNIYMQEIIDIKSIYIQMKPLWETVPIFDRIIKVYETYDWIKPVDVYINKFGRKIKIMKPLIIGSIYVMKLKQSSKKNFSARTTGALSKKGVPDKSVSNKIHQDLYSSTPIRIGDQENTNSFIGVHPDIVAKMHLFYRSSIMARRWLGKKLMKNIKPIEELKSNKDFMNRNLEIFKTLLKCMGLKYTFDKRKPTIKLRNNDIRDFELNGKTYTCTEKEFEDIKLRYKVEQKYRKKHVFIGTKENYQAKIDKLFIRAKCKRDGRPYIGKR